MMNKTSIKYLYKHTKRPKNGFPASVLDKITEECSQFHKISFDKDKMTIGALDDGNPFKYIRLTCINGFEIIDHVVAVVMHTGIIFLNNENGSIRIHFKKERQSVWSKIIQWFHHDCKCCPSMEQAKMEF